MYTGIPSIASNIYKNATVMSLNAYTGIPGITPIEYEYYISLIFSYAYYGIPDITPYRYNATSV